MIEQFLLLKFDRNNIEFINIVLKCNKSDIDF